MTYFTKSKKGGFVWKKKAAFAGYKAYTSKHHAAASKLKSWWKRRSPARRYRPGGKVYQSARSRFYKRQHAGYK